MDLNLLLFTFLIAVSGTSATWALFSHSCTIGAGNFCIFSSINTTETNLLLRPTADETDRLLKVKIQNSTLYEFTSEICATFSKIKNLEIVQTDIYSINFKAFIKCISLESLKFIKSHIRIELDDNIFNSNINLRELVLDDVGLTSFNCNILQYLKKLETLVVTNNRIKFIPFHQMPKLDCLKNLVISANTLLDFDEYEILRKFVSLTNIDISHNYLDCSRVKLMLKVFKLNNIYIGKMWRAEHTSFILGIEQKKEGDVECSDLISNEFKTERLYQLNEELRWNRHFMYNLSSSFNQALNTNGNLLLVTVYLLSGLTLLNFCFTLFGVIWIHCKLKNKMMIGEQDANSRTVVTYSK